MLIAVMPTASCPSLSQHVASEMNEMTNNALFISRNKKKYFASPAKKHAAVWVTIFHRLLDGAGHYEIFFNEASHNFNAYFIREFTRD